MSKTRDRNKQTDDETKVTDKATVRKDGDETELDTDAGKEGIDLGESDKQSDEGIEAETMTDAAAEKIQDARAEGPGDEPKGTTEAGAETAADRVGKDEIINPSAKPAKNENPAVNVTATAGVGTGTGRRNIEEWTKDYQGQIYQVTATVNEKANTIVGYTNDPTGGGLVEFVDGATDMYGPHIIKLTDEAKIDLYKNK